MRKLYLTLFLVSVIFSILPGQNSSITLLKKKLETAQGINQIEILDLLSEAYLQKDNAKATLYAEKALKDINNYKLTVSPEVQANLYNTLGAVFFYEEDFNKSFDYYKKEHEIVSRTLARKQTAKSFFNMGVLSQKTGQYKEAANYFEQGLVIAKALDNIELQLHFFKARYFLYDEWGQSESALASLAEYTTIKDQQFIYTQNVPTVLRRNTQSTDNFEESSISEAIRNELMADTTESGRRLDVLRLERVYSKKISEQQAALNKASQELDKLQVQAVRAQYIYFALIFILLAVGGFFLYKMSRRNKRARSQLDLQAELLEDANGLLLEKNSQIFDNISYARRMQDSILMPEAEIKKYLPEAFIYYQPKDIVSGDFYWFSKIEDEFVLAAIDCSGHGVPGAFMSIIGYTLLNEIVNEKKITKPDRVLKHLHLGVMAALQKAGSDSSDDDGMDMSLCTINPRLKRFQFAGAKNHLYVLQGDNLKVLKANHHTVGGRPLRDDITVDFTSYDFMYDEKTSIYMMSDGYMDQFGGSEDTKFNAKRLKKMLIDNRHLPMEEQKTSMQKTLNEWKGNRDQVDDILIVGVKLD